MKALYFTLTSMLVTATEVSLLCRFEIVWSSSGMCSLYKQGT